MEVFMLNVTEYISPECTCKVENMVAKLDHVASVEFNPLTQILKVTAHQGMTTREALTKHLEDCGIHCSDEARAPHHRYLTKYAAKAIRASLESVLDMALLLLIGFGRWRKPV